MITADQKYTILYARLSQEDEQRGESNSIHNQRTILEKYAAEHGFRNLRFLADDGYTGTNFNRPAFREALELIEQGQVETFIVKDMSRFGRDYLQVGHYTEILFPSCDVRFIAINDAVDSLYGSDDFTPFRNVMNELYAKDTSEKVRAANRAKAERGERVGCRPPYGYQWDETRRHLVSDPSAAETVRLIFRLCTQGLGPSKIANELERRQVVNPSNHYFRKTGAALTNLNVTKPYHWSSQSVARILEDESYLGHTINLKFTTKSFKLKKRLDRPVAEQVRIENTHEPLISKETWDIVREVRQHRRRITRFDEPSLFSGMVYCVDCGQNMHFHRSHTKADKWNHFTCSTYRNRGKSVCSGHYIREDQLIEIVLDDLRRTTHYARRKEKLFAAHINRASTRQARQQLNRLEQELLGAEKRDAEISTLFKRLYEDHVLERITAEQFRMLSDGYNEEQTRLREGITENRRQQEQLQGSMTGATHFIEKARKYTEIDVLTPELLRLFIRRIEVGKRAEKYSRTAEQKLWIHYRDVGCFDLPMTDETPGETA